MLRRNICLILAYDGAAYKGWQKTSMGPSVEETLQHVLEKILQQKVVLQAASRTDAGVHAEGQVVNFFSEKKLPLKFQLSLNQLLPKDIKVIRIKEMSASFHPTLDAIGKEYHYWISHGPYQLPFHRHTSWHFPYPFDIQLIHQAIPYFIGEKDFSALCNVKKNDKETNFVRRVDRIGVEEQDSRLKFTVSGNRFLYKMVRNIVGTLMYVGCGKIALEDVPLILEGKERTAAGMTAPAHGLTLHRVYYNEDI